MAGLSRADITQRVAQALKQSVRTVQYCVRFAEEFPDPSQLPGGKNISWRKVCHEVLTGKGTQDECVHAETEMIPVCKCCHKRVKPE